MKKLLLLLVVLLGNITMSNAQTETVITLIGAGVGGWADENDIPLETIDGIVYTIEELDIEGEVKFRQNNNWDVNWGGTFPSGVGAAGGANIKVPAGTYNVTFNLTTAEYLFKSNAPLKPTVIIYGSAFGKGSGSLVSTDDANFTIGAVLGEGEIKFESVVNEVKTVWGGTGLEGTAVALTDPAAAGIALTPGKYMISINITTGAYSFMTTETVPFPSIGIIGTATAGGWAEDTDMMTEDGVNYYIKNVTLLDGAIKFRQDNAWDIAWGGTAFPSGDPSDSDIVAVAGTYDIMLNRLTAVYSIVDSSLSTDDFSASSFSIYPNPVANGTLYFSEAQNVSVYDLSGRLVAQASNAASVDVSGLVKGIYLVKTSNGVSKQFIVK